MDRESDERLNPLAADAVSGHPAPTLADPQRPAEETVALLLKLARESRWNEPRSAGQWLEEAPQLFEPLFQQPPIGPIPEHLQPHHQVYGCVAAYEDQLEALDCWKIGALADWLRKHSGRPVKFDHQTLVLRSAGSALPDVELFWIELSSDQSGAAALPQDHAAGAD